MAVAAALLTAACGGEAPTRAEAKQGLTVARGEAGAVVGSYRKGDVVVSFEARRGEANPTQQLEADPGAPAFSVAARFLDGDGKTFLVQLGGHADDTAGWPEAEGATDPAARVEAIQLVPLAVEALAGAGLGPDVSPEIEALAGLAEAVRGVELVKEPEGDVPFACGAGYFHYFQIRSKPAFGISSYLAEHSAIFADSYYQGWDCRLYYQGSVYSCNHGTCAPNMATVECGWLSGLRSNFMPPVQGAYGGEACTSSGYDATSIFGHNCNDDTYFQVFNILYNTTYSSVGPNAICRDASTHSYAPTCYGGR